MSRASPAPARAGATAADLRGFDWSPAWLAPLRDLRSVLTADHAAANRVAAARGICNRRGDPIRFVPADRPSIDYEAGIAATGCVPTRSNRHDLLNAVIWLTLPRTKAALNALHEPLAAHFPAHFPAHVPAHLPKNARAAGRRGSRRDAATLFDENGLLLACSDRTVVEDLRAMQWRRLFVERRARFIAATWPLVVGHALIEKLARPYKAITAHVLPLIVSDDLLAAPADERRAALDDLAAAALARSLRTPRDLAPLPVLGIPGWWPANEDAAFYEDSTVFRARRGSVQSFGSSSASSTTLSAPPAAPRTSA